MRPGDTFARSRRDPLWGAAVLILLVLLAGGAVTALMGVSSQTDVCPWPDSRNTAARSDAAASPKGRDDPCDLVIGPAHDYCRRDVAPVPAPGSAASPSAPCTASRTVGQVLLCLGGIAVLVSFARYGRWSR
ncbi:hypothetical protein [Streptomyces nanshensis]|uniref:Uncharacterized protein n=1 Tax=Streptomyces nanshensis TaxID=518642 RepID=A0A1E7L403_9ACTN|nr:hypothetical protein [Streptomyces nanshensis]OEV10914.1 hypothetical protein AN218_15330 [Streptomyces nanshensis]